MLSLIHVEVAATGFLVLLFFTDFVKRQLNSIRSMLFQFLLGSIMISSFFKLNRDLYYKYSSYVELGVVIACISWLTAVICALALHYYILALTNRLRKHSLRFYIDTTVFTGIALLIITSPITHLCYYVEDGVIKHNTLFNAVAVVLFGYMVYDLLLIWIYKKEYSIWKKLMCSGTVVGFMLILSTEVLNSSKIILLDILLVFFTFIYYLSFQSPDYYVDNATGTYNRNGFITVFRERITYGKETHCFIVRVRNFNSLTRIYGEEILRTIQKNMGGILEEILGNNDVYHIGASTFGVILESDEQVEKLYEKIKEMLPNVWSVNEEAIKHDYSYYKVAYPEDGQDFQELMQRVHYARSDHENHHKPGELIQLRHDTVEDAERKNEVAHLIEEAVMDNSIELNMQPIYSIEKDRITSLEILARLKDENKEYINPEYFIHVAEENHMIVPLGEQIFRKACIFASQNNIFDMGIEDININLSPGQCRYEELTERFIGIAKQYSIPMEKIHMEITESEFTDAEAVGRTLKRLKETGAKVALDDFGTGFSTLSNILELPVDLVKIDKSLVWSYAEGKNQFLNDLMPMIKADGKKIIAEGIESEEHIEIIKKLQGDFLQGYYFSKPLTEKEFMRYLWDFRRKHSY